jgi:leader peptidase (prepilin peptidase)/N-methyltransferase
MGGGDVKLAALIGFFLGWKLALVALFLAVLVATVFGIGLIIIKRKSRKDAIPFGPFLALGAFFSLLWGNLMIFWYVQHFFY